LTLSVSSLGETGLSCIQGCTNVELELES
jgi:hypothetical protein